MMKAITVVPRQKHSVKLEEIPEPHAGESQILVETLAAGICGTDREIISGVYGWAPKGAGSLVLGHESLGRVLSAPAGSGFSRGDLVVPIVRHPDPVPCPNCAIGEWDMCRNGLYQEHGIKELDGFCRERYAIDPPFLVKLDSRLGMNGILLEPASIIAKAWEQVERIQRRLLWKPKTVLITGAGPVGLLCTLFARRLGYETHVLDLVSGGIKPELVRKLGATYHVGTPMSACARPDITMECTGAVELVAAVMDNIGPNGIVCLAGVSKGSRVLSFNAGEFSRNVVLENEVIFGTVNANRRHYEKAAETLMAADSSWLEAMVTRRVPLKEWNEAYLRRRDDVKVVLEWRS